MDQGIKGRDLGIKIKELEIEKFKQMIWYFIHVWIKINSLWEHLNI
jgi:hypothetical protein